MHLKKLHGEALREFVAKKQWENYCCGPEVIHQKLPEFDYPQISKHKAEQMIEAAEKHLNPELHY